MFGLAAFNHNIPIHNHQSILSSTQPILHSSINQLSALIFDPAIYICAHFSIFFRLFFNLFRLWRTPQFYIFHFTFYIPPPSGGLPPQNHPVNPVKKQAILAPNAQAEAIVEVPSGVEGSTLLKETSFLSAIALAKANFETL